VVVEPAGVSAMGDRRFLGDVIKNLIENAVKFADKPEKKVALWVGTKDDKVLVSVQDNGPGIPPEDQELIFSRFHQVEASFTGQVEGWGLGLPFVKKVADLHGGSVNLISRLGEGTTVTVSLPRSRA
jgi:signal transduction histidine kinase